MKIQTLRLGAACLFLVGSLTSCASKPIVRTETVEVERPVIVGVPAELTRTPPEPQLPVGAISNDDLADYVDALKAWGRGMVKQLQEIAGLAPTEPRP